MSTRADLRLFVPALVAWATGAAALAWGAPLRWAVVGCCALVAVLGLVRLHRGGPRRPVPTAVATATAVVTALVVAASTLAQTQHEQGLVSRAVADESVVTAEVTLEADARRVVSEGRFGRSELVLVRARAHRIVHRGQESTADAPLLVLAKPGRGWDGLTWRTRLTVSGRLAPSEPGDDVVAVLTPARAPQDVAAPGGGWRVAEGLREGLRQAVDPVWADARGLVPGLVLGDTSLTPEDLTQAMTETGMTHLSAVSGSNVAIVVGAVLWVAAGVGLPRRARPWAAAAGLVAFVVLARPEPSVLRAGVMGAVGLVAMTASRRAASFPALAASMVVLLLWDPWLARSYGFALSVLATLGLVLFVRPWAAALRRRWPRLPEPVAQGLVIPVAAAVTTSPVVAMLQGQVSVVGLLTNLLAAPLVAPATLGGVVVVLVHPVSPLVAGWAAWVAAVPAQVIGLTARWGAAVPYGAVPWPSSGPAALGMALLLAAAVLLGPGLWRWAGPRLRRLVLPRPGSCVLPGPREGTGQRTGQRIGQGRLETGALCLAAGTAVALWGLPGVTQPLLTGRDGAAADWRVVMCDVGQGDALLLRTGPQRAVLVDTGPAGAPVAACLRRSGVHALDAVVVTHSHADHSGNLGAVLDAVSVDRVWASPEDLARPMQPGHPAEWREVARARGVAVEPFGAGTSQQVGTARLRAVWPRPGVDLAADDRRNDGSLVVHATVDGPDPGPGSAVTVLLTGDLEESGGAAVQQLTASDRVDVLKVPHHGSAHQGRGLLDRGAPLSLLSVGAQNDYGHPADRTVEALRAAGSTVVSTAEEGTVAVGRDTAGTLWWGRP